MPTDDRCVLVVDDDDDIRESLSMILDAEGFRPATASDGGEALAWLRAHAPPCAILLDLMMPGMSGQEFRARQLDDPSLARIPTVIVSAGDNVSRVAADIGADAYLRKPLDVDRLLAVLRARCGAR